MLTINPSEVIWTILGFFALYFLLKRFLYDPLIRLMDERNAKVQAGLDEEKAALDALQAQQERLKQGREESRGEARALLDRARQQDEQRHDERIREARSAAQQAGADAQSRADALYEQAEGRLREQREELASALAERLFSEGNKA